MNKDIVKPYRYIEYIRIAGMIFILLCHFTQQNQNQYIQMTGQFFNIGVPLFFILSGFLYGAKKGEIQKCIAWYANRIKRIFIPYELFVIILFAIYIYMGLEISLREWILLMVGAQGSVVGIWGAEQTWFISSLLICYLITPSLSIYVNRTSLKYIILFSILMPILLSMINEAWWFTIFTPIVEYLMAFYIGQNIDDIKLSCRRIALLIAIMSGAFAFRIFGRIAFDGTILYDRLIVFYTQMIGAFCIFFIIMYIFYNVKVYAPIQFLSNISFEVYLTHYMLTVGPISLFGLTPFWISDCICAFCVSVIVSLIIHITSKYFIKYIDDYIIQS